MGSFKGLERSDVYLTDYIAKKQWKVTGSLIGSLGIGLAHARSGSLPYYPVSGNRYPFRPLSGSMEEQDQAINSGSTYDDRLLYESLKHLYYTASNQDGTFRGPSEWYPQTTLTLSGSRTLPTRSYDPSAPDEVVIINITFPRDIIGLGMEMGSLDIEPDEDVYNYVERDYCYDSRKMVDCGGCSEEFQLDKQAHPEDPYFEDLGVGHFKDFEGVVYAEDSFAGTWSIKPGYDYPSPDYQDSTVVGDIIYSHGQVILTQEFFAYVLANWDLESVSWRSNQPIFTQHVHCKVEDREFNRSSNPSIPVLVESVQETDPEFSEEEVTPYITTIGLYNTVGDLLAVAKLNKPIKKAPNVDMTLEVRIDLG